jgi:ribose transport system permease protein
MGSRLLSDYGMFLVLLVLCVYFSYATYQEQPATGATGGEALARDIVRQTPPKATVLIAVSARPDDAAFAAALAKVLTAEDRNLLANVQGNPADVRQQLQAIADRGSGLAAIAATAETGKWTVLEDLGQRYPSLRGVRVFVPPESYAWPNFLKVSNLLNIPDQIAILAVLAIGMTLVIITGGIDLSVGSLVALAAVLSTLFIRDLAGGSTASTAGMTLCCVAAIAVCGLLGLVNGLCITTFALPPFIMTLGMMLIASGLAYEWAQGETISQVPPAFTELARGSALGGVPNTVLLMAILYLLGHVLMSRTVLGRYIYAVGGNAEAARLSGVPVRRVVTLVYVLSGLLAGLGGVLLASQLNGGSPTYAKDYELSAIAMAVVGGTSLSGGEGRVFGTLIGAFVIGVIQNGMNLVGVTSYRQRIVLGAIIIGAVLFDRAKHYVPGLRFTQMLTRKRA